MTIFMTYYETMTKTLKVNVGEAKARFAECLKRVERGETVIVARRNQPVAELRPIGRHDRRPRPFGLCAGEFSVPADFDAPLPAALLDSFEGQ